MFKKLKNIVLHFIILTTFFIDTGIIKPLNHDPVPEPVPYRLCAPALPAKTCTLWI